MPLPEDLPSLRRAIDDVNLEILGLLNRRAELALAVGERKRKLEREAAEAGTPLRTTPFFAPSRESQIFDQLAAANQGPLQTDAILSVFREIISQCRALEEPMKVAYWGPHGSHSHEAALMKFGTAAEFRPVASIAAVFTQVEKQLCHYGVVPAGNSLEGLLSRTLDLLAQHEARICAEAYLPVSYDLLSNCGGLDQIKVVYASAQPLALCSGWLSQNLPDCQIVETPSISKSIEACYEDSTAAAVASHAAAEQARLGLLESHIEDDASMRGRFFVIGFNEPSRSGRDKTSLLLRLPHRPGAMVSALTTFSRHNVNLTFVQSRHAPRSTNTYYVFVELSGFVEDEPIARALAEMTRNGISLTLLGSYPDELPLQEEPTD